MRENLIVDFLNVERISSKISLEMLKNTLFCVREGVK